MITAVPGSDLANVRAEVDLLRGQIDTYSDEKAIPDDLLVRFVDATDRKAELESAAERGQAAQRARSAVQRRGGAVVEYRGDGSGQIRSGESFLPSLREYKQMEQRSVGISGSVFALQQQATDFVDRLRAHSVIFGGSNIPTIPVPTGSLRIPKITASVTVSSTTENTAITPTDPTFGSVTLLLKKFAGLTLASSESFSDSVPEVRDVIAADLSRQVGTVLDQQFIAGNGSGANILGIRNVSGVTAGPSMGANGAAITSLDTLATMVGSLETANGDLSKAVFIVHPRTWAEIRLLKDSQSRYQINPIPGAGEPREVFGIPVLTSTNVPVNETQGTSSGVCSSIILLDASQARIGYGTPDNGLSSPYGPTYVDISTDLGITLAYSDQAFFGSDQLAIRVTARFDLQVLNPAAVVITTGVL